MEKATVAELKAMLGNKGLKKQGMKEQLIAQLREAESSVIYIFLEKLTAIASW